MKRLLAIRWAWVLLLGLTSTGLSAQPETPTRVLFVGNSFTFYNDGLHNHVGNLLRASGTYAEQGIRLRALTLSGGRLAEHAGGIASVVQPDTWDLVVMHGHSTAMDDADTAGEFGQAARVISRYLRDNGAEPAFLMTWPYLNRPQMLGNLKQGYNDVGRLLDALVIPAGEAFARINREHPEINLYQQDLLRYEGDQPVYREDIKHPNTAGTYLTAAVVVAAVFGESPVGNPWRADIAPETAAILQQVAWETAQNAD